MTDHVAKASAERTIDFYGDPIIVAVMPDDEVYVPIRPIVEFLGLDWSGQYQRIQRDTVLARRAEPVVVTTADGRQRETVCLPLDLLPGWLFGISPSRVRPELSEKLNRYREECFRVLWRAFQADAVSSVGPMALQTNAVGNTGTSLMQIRELGLAVAHMADQQLAIEQRTTEHASRLDRAATVIKEMQRRLSVIEDQVQPSAYLTDAQAAELANLVKAIAKDLSERDKSKNHYQSVFGELYRRFNVSSYKRVRQDQFADVLAFLDEWHTTMQSSSPAV
ncbi:MAG: hypothetical protein NVS2B7_34410 [Herpetosiphon sp.]